MQSSSRRLSRSVVAAACLGLAGSVLAAVPASAANDVVDPTSRLFVDWQSSTLEQAADLRRRIGDAQFIDGLPGGDTEDEMKRFFRDDSAATSIEYALIATLISIVIIGGATSIGQTVKNLFFDNVNAGFSSR